MKRQVFRFVDHYCEMVLAMFVAMLLRREDSSHHHRTGPVWNRRTGRIVKVAAP
jgi:hypothetical protein